MFWASLVSSAIKNLPANAEDTGSIPELGRSLGKGNSNPLQYSCLENPMYREAWWVQFMGSEKNQTVTTTTVTSSFYPCEMATERLNSCRQGKTSY